MSEIYILEPTTSGKVILHTTHGPLDVELWTNECPKTCRNFLQLCVDKYYDDNIFHRVIPGFIVQTGDPTGTGLGGESIYGDQPFKTEIHPRLAFRYRGMLGLAALGDDDQSLDPDIVSKPKHGSQFFITLARADGLTKKCTLFGKVTGHSLYNLLSIAETPINPKNNVPLDPPKIESVQIITSPYDDLAPRPHSRAAIEEEQRCSTAAQSQPKITTVSATFKKKQLLSFNDEDEDLTNPAPVEITNKPARQVVENLTALKLASLKHNIKKHLKSAQTHQENDQEEFLETSESDRSSHSTDDEEAQKSELISERIPEQQLQAQEEARKLKMELLSFKKGQGTVKAQEQEFESVQDADLISNFTERKLEEFQRKLREASFVSSDQKDSNDEEDDPNWFKGQGLKFAVDSARAYELDAAYNALAVFDPLSSVSSAEVAEKMRKFKNLRSKPSLRTKSKHEISD